MADPVKKVAENFTQPSVFSEVNAAEQDDNAELQRLLAQYAEKVNEKQGPIPIEDGIDFTEDHEVHAIIDRIRELAPEELPVTDPNFPYYIAKEKEEKLEETLDLNKNPTWHLLSAMQLCCDAKSKSAFANIAKNDALLTESSQLTKFSSRLRSEEKDNKGLDFSNDEEAKTLIQTVYNKYPDIFGKIKVDENKRITSFKFSHSQVEGIKSACGEQIQILLARQQVNKAYVENDLKELTHLWELMNQSVKEYTHSNQHIIGQRTQ